MEIEGQGFIKIAREYPDYDEDDRFADVVLWCAENFERDRYLLRRTDDNLFFYSDDPTMVIHFKLRWVG